MPTKNNFIDNGLLRSEIKSFIEAQNISLPFSIIKTALSQTETLTTKIFSDYASLKSIKPVSLFHLKEFNTVSFEGVDVKIAISKDNTTWKTFNGSTWEIVDISNANKDFVYSKLNTPTEILSLTDLQLKDLLGDIEDPKFYVFIMFGGQGELDKISLNIDLKGYFKFSPIETSINEETNKIIMKFPADGNYKIKYKIT
jgi:hypothetical protein